MNSIGLCKHNNVESYCPSCVREKSYNSRAQLSGRVRSLPKFYQPIKPAYYGPGTVYALNRSRSGMRGGMGGFWDFLKPKTLPPTASSQALESTGKEKPMYPEKYHPEDYNLYPSMSGFGGGMGTTCQPGFYNLKVFGIDTGQCLPSLSTAVSAAQTGVTSSVATGVATNPANIAAAKQAGISATANAAVAYVKSHPVMIASIVGGIALLAMYGTGKLAFGRNA